MTFLRPRRHRSRRRLAITVLALGGASLLAGVMVAWWLRRRSADDGDGYAALSPFDRDALDRAADDGMPVRIPA